jgi:hypothetical protein
MADVFHRDLVLPWNDLVELKCPQCQRIFTEAGIFHIYFYETSKVKGQDVEVEFYLPVCPHCLPNIIVDARLKRGFEEQT